MTSVRRHGLLVGCLCAGVAFATVGCHKQVPPQPAPPPPPVATQTPPPPLPPPPPAPSASNSSLAQPRPEKSVSDVFFEFNQSELSADARDRLQKDAEWLKQSTSTKVTIEGHCDERGTAEYNLALGERRAAAAKNYLVSLGVDADRISVVSMGKEDPFCTQHDESCWSQNRRGHFIIKAN